MKKIVVEAVFLKIKKQRANFLLYKEQTNWKYIFMQEEIYTLLLHFQKNSHQKLLFSFLIFYRYLYLLVRGWNIVFWMSKIFSKKPDIWIIEHKVKFLFATQFYQKFVKYKNFVGNCILNFQDKIYIFVN